MDFLFGQQIVKLNWVMGISLAKKTGGPTDTEVPATFCYETFLRDQLPEVLTEELISSASLIDRSSFSTWKEHSTLCRKIP